MACPRVIKGLLNKIYPGQIGPIVRKIILNARFPVYLPSLIYKPWKSVLVMFGGSATSLKAAILGFKIASRAGVLYIFFTQNENKDLTTYKTILKSNRETRDILSKIQNWHFF